MSKMYLSLPEEFSYEMNFQFLERSPRELLHRVENNSVVKLLKAGDEKVLFRIRPGDGKLMLDFLNGTPSAEAKSFVRAYVTEWFDLETDLKPFYTMASGDKILKALVDRFYGYRIMGQPDLFESIVWAVLGQQINLQFAYTLKQRFVEQFGERLFWNEQSYFLFPTARLVAELKDEVLLPLQFSRQKSRYTITIAEAFASGELSKEKLKGLTLEDAKEKLMKIKGVGNWTANYALMKTFRYRDAFPLEDAGVHNAIKNLKKMDRKPTLDEVRKFFKKYKGWEAYATLYLWKSL
ncbi:DNA-3-methyladenine glycosylase [Fulvivirgaceae bacterium PWU4]|uniref:DNA-3-methyladenine glycosylase II n=1 Tax=Chryseosolibacter histidini TaxID=2782349 RepID=A0AAP2DIW1_9BACT|nr:DNA-3-methyladenine glycosylase [Chryseosolibacter histidini]MBT1696208.1 DNA-3-methyladenine glycosylase [Chryseosolibacter histidini]